LVGEKHGGLGREGGCVCRCVVGLGGARDGTKRRGHRERSARWRGGLHDD
jgi:hypothetical protein